MSLETRPCERCRRRIVWGWTERGERIPLDPDPTDSGNQATYRDGTGRVRTRQVPVGEPVEPYERRRMPHFATCGSTAPRPVRQADGVLSLAAARDRRRRQPARRTN